jgi:glutathione synthase
MNIAIQIDHISKLNMLLDSSMFVALSLQLHGHKVFYYHPETLLYKDKVISADLSEIIISYTNRYIIDHVSENNRLDLSEFDLILIRQDPPFDMNYVTTCYLLNMINSDKCLVLNNPASILQNSEKLAALEFSEYIPKTIIASNINIDVTSFIENQKHVIAKPLYGHGGRGITLINNTDPWNVMLEELIDMHGTIVLQEFLPEVKSDGDKRVYMIDGEVIGALQRIPKAGDIKANISAGGTAYKTSLTDREKEICKSLSGWLKENEIVFAGIDILNGYLIEINITSPTGLTNLMLLKEIDLLQVGKVIENSVVRIKSNRL